jgi:hypothetical protein
MHDVIIEGSFQVAGWLVNSSILFTSSGMWMIIWLDK